MPDKCVKFAVLGLKDPSCPAGYQPNLDYRVVVHRVSGQSATIPVKDVGPWNIDDNYWDPPQGPRPRRLFTDLPQGTPEAQAAFYNGYNTVANCKNLDGQPSGHPGPADQFGRCVLNPAGIDLSLAAAAALGLGPGQNEWVTVTFLWESASPPPPAPAGAPVASSPQFGAPNQTDLFDVNKNGAVEVRWVVGAGSWNGPLVISPPSLAPPGAHVVASNQFGLPNQTDVFVVGNDGATKALWVDGAGAWNGPLAITPANADPPGAPLAASNQFGVGNQTDVFIVNINSAVQVSWVSGAGAWNGPMSITRPNTVPLEGELAASPQFGVPAQTDVFSVDGNGVLQVSWVSGAGAWNGPMGIGPPRSASTSLAASSQFGLPQQTDVFTVDKTNGAVYVSWVSSAGAWNGPLAISPLGFADSGAALAASNQFGVPDQTDVFVVGADGATRVSWVEGASSWNGPTAITPTGLFPRGAGLAASPQFGIPNQTDVFAVGNDGATRVSWVDGASNWNGPMAI